MLIFSTMLFKYKKSVLYFVFGKKIKLVSIFKFYIYNSLTINSCMTEIYKNDL